MKVALAASLPPWRGGVAQHAGRLARAFIRQGAELEVFAWTRPYPGILYRGEQPDPESGTTVGEFRLAGRLTWWNPISWFSSARQVRNCDILVIPWVTPFHWLPHLILTIVGAVPTVFVVHNAQPHEWFPLSRPLTRVVLRRASGLVAHSNDVAASLDEMGIDVPTTVVPHPPNLEIRPAPLPDVEPLRLLFVGYVRPYKGLERLLHVMSGWSDGDASLTVAGEFWSPSVKEIQELARDLGLENRVRLLPGYVADEDLIHLIRSHHLVVLPYVAGSQSGIVPIAHAAARPVLVTDVGGLAECVVDGVNGIVCFNDEGGLEAGLRRALTGVQTLAEGAAATTVSWDELAHAIVALGDPVDRGRKAVS